MFGQTQDRVKPFVRVKGQNKKQGKNNPSYSIHLIIVQDRLVLKY